MGLVRKLRKLSEKYGVEIVRELYDGIYSKYVVDFAGKNPQDFEDYWYEGRKKAKEEMIKYLDKFISCS